MALWLLSASIVPGQDRGKSTFSVFVWDRWRIAFYRSDFLLAHRLLKRSRDASGKPLELVVLRTQGKKDRPKAVSGDLAASAEACAHDTVGIPVKDAQAKTAPVRRRPD
jgi:hypothetical protein